MNPSDLASRCGEWLKGTGPEADVVISTRLRLARNLVGFPFLIRAGPEDRKRLLRLVSERIRGTLTGKDYFFCDLEVAEPIDRQVLVERHLISRELAEGEGSRGVAFSPDESVAIMINEEDHLRLQVLRSGLEVETAWKEIERIDGDLEKKLTFAFSPELGYLTACPTNVGTGLRASVMLHLPALVMTDQVDKVINAVSKLSLAVRGLYGEGTQASGDFYQISNQITLGETEGEILESLRSVVPQIISSERKAREALLSENRVGLEDRIWRSYGMLKSARSITSEETMQLLSGVRLGVNLRLLPDLRMRTVNEIFMMAQPGHLQKIEGKELTQPRRDVARAEFIRSRLNGKRL